MYDDSTSLIIWNFQHSLHKNQNKSKTRRLLYLIISAVTPSTPTVLLDFRLRIELFNFFRLVLPSATSSLSVLAVT